MSEFNYKPKGNRQYKDALFKFIFGSEERKEYALQLYNALNDTDYMDVSALTFVTLEDVLYLNYHNDVACIVDPTVINMWEEQSSWNPNMPIRFFLYLAGEWGKYLYATNQEISQKKQVKVPWPNCIVLYNGREDEEAVRTVSIKDNLMKPKSSKTTEIEFNVMVYNMNIKKGHELFSKCRALYEYAWMITHIQKYMKEHGYGMTKEKLAEGIRRMIEEIPEDFELYELMHQKQQEVISMLLTEFDAKRHDAIMFDNGKEEGMAKGIAKGLAEGISKGKKEGLKALISSLSPYINNVEDMYKAVIANDSYKDVSFETVKKLFGK